MSINENPTWRRKLPHSTDNIHFIDWLRDRGSLTERLQARGSFAVKLLRQGLGRPTIDEACALDIERKQVAWVREVALYCNDRPLVFAHTVLAYRPRGAMTGWLARLGNRSLGALLFSHAGFKRGTISVRRIDHRHSLFRRAVEAMALSKPPCALWARRSLFSFGAQSVLVTEVFSPDLRPKNGGSNCTELTEKNTTRLEAPKQV